jgi:hypothetical protein
MKIVLGYLYWGDVYDAYGKRQVTVKVNGAAVKDSALLRTAEQEWAAAGVVKTVTPQGVLYRIA